MPPELWERVKDLYDAALTFEPSQRAAFLEAQGDDQTLIAEVKSLLSEEQKMGGFMDIPPMGDSPGSIPEKTTWSGGSRYEFFHELGRGGMGIVYEARDRHTGETVAVKVLRPDIAANADLVRRFTNEVRLAHKITHKNICRTFDIHLEDGAAAISMELVRGDSLRSILNRFGGLTLQKAIDVAHQMCCGLAEAHCQGIVHRDLKPENVMIGSSGEVKIMDFGIAKSVETGQTQGNIVGTPAYMAPEQVEGQKVGPWTDIYALGLVMYEVLTGTPTFAGDTPIAIALKQVSITPRPLRELNPALPPKLESVILRCLQKDPAKRFQSANDLDVALSQVADFSNQENLPPTSLAAYPDKAPSARRSRISMLGWACLVVSLLTVGAFIGFFAGQRWQPSQSPMHHSQTVRSVAFSPDSRWIASASDDKTIRLWSVDHETEKFALRVTRAAQSLAFSPYGKLLVSGGVDGTIKIWNPDTGEALRTLQHSKRPVTTVEFNPDGRLIASAGGEGVVSVWETQSGREVRTLKSDFMAITALSFSPDGHWLASGGEDRKVTIWDLSSWRETRQLEGHAEEIECVAFSPKDRMVASGSFDGEIKLWEGDGSLFRTLPSNGFSVNSVAFSPGDGRWLVSGSSDGTLKYWAVQTGQEVGSLKSGCDSINDLAISQDGAWLAWGCEDGTVNRRRFEPGGAR